MFAALKRLNIYQKEMYPIISRLLLGYLVFGEGQTFRHSQRL